jgi:hypothetical protein
LIICPVLVERLIAIISSPLSDDGYKQLALTIYYQLLESEYETTESFSLVERYTIDSLYEVANISPDRAHAAMDKMYNITWGQFDSLMLSDPNNAKAAALCKEGRRFLDHLKNLFTLMSSLFTHPSDPEWEYDRTAVALRLIRYIEMIQKLHHHLQQLLLRIKIMMMMMMMLITLFKLVKLCIHVISNI